MLRSVARFDKPGSTKERGASIRSPLDKRRYQSMYAGDLDPDTLGDILCYAEAGNLGPLQEVAARIRGRDGIIDGIMATRLAAVSGCAIRIKHNPSDHPLDAIEAAIFVERWIKKLKLLKRKPEGIEEIGGFHDVLESIASVFYTGINPFWIYYNKDYNDPWLTPFGIEAIEPYRVRLDPYTQSTSIETNESSTGEPLSNFSPLLYVNATAQRAGVPLCYAGAASKLLFPWWLGGLSDEALAKYLDRFGVPIPIAKESAKGDINGGYDETESGQLDEAVKNIHTDNLGMVIPGTAIIEIFSPPAGGENLYKYVREECERRINYTLAGQTGTNTGEGGSYAKAKINYQVRGDLIQRDRMLVGSVLQRIAQRALWFFFKGRVRSVPIIELYDPSIENPDGTPKEQAKEAA